MNCNRYKKNETYYRNCFKFKYELFFNLFLIACIQKDTFFTGKAPG